MSDIKISVVVPVYNAAKFLPRCLDSILGQDYQNLEVICVNDGSTDESLSILQIYAQKDSRVKVISQPNQGIAGARNTGLKNVTGEYVSFIDADDFIYQELYSSFTQAVQKDKVDIFMFNGVVNGSGSFFTPNNFYKPISEYQNITYKDFYGVFYGNSSVCNKIFKNSFLKKNNMLFEDSCCEDIGFWFKGLVLAQNIKVSFRRFYNYMSDNSGSVTKHFGQNALNLFDMFNTMLETAKKAGVDIFYQDALFQYQYEKVIETMYLMLPEYQEQFFFKAKEFLQNRISQLKGESYKNLLNFGNCYNLIHNDFIDFKNSTLLFREKFNYVAEKPKNLRFSVVVPVYNVEAYLDTCLKSLINQTFQDFEIICVNDGSTDKSGDILNYHGSKDARIKIINQENKGLGAARNVGVAQAQGEYLVFVDSDDWLRTNALEVLDKQLKDKPVEVCLFGYNEFHDGIRVNVHMQILNQLKQQIADKETDILDYMFVSLSAWSKVYRRDFWKQHNFSFVEGMFFEDVLPNAQIFAKIKSFSICWQNLYFYRLSADSITRKMFSDKKINDFFEVYEQTYSFLQQAQIYPQVQSKFVALVQNCFNYYLKQIPEHAKADYLSRLSSFIQRISHA